MRRAALAAVLGTMIVAAPPAHAQDWDVLRDMMLEMGDSLEMDGFG